MARRKPNYPGLDDPRAALEPLRSAETYVLDLKRRFHIATPAYTRLEAIREALRAAALELTKDPHFFGLPPPGQSVYQPPPAPPVPGQRPGRS
jgi:hypothetical protein